MSSLLNDERRFLLRLARQTLEVRLASGPAALPAPEAGNISPALREPAGVFVSLHAAGELRGCVGFVEPRLPLFRAVMEMAFSAATSDPRFPPVRPAELPALEIEISVLSQPQPITASEIKIGTHGLIVSYGAMRGLLLPQVAAERNWSPERFLEEACRKAGLPTGAWQSSARVEAFEADVFGEKSLAEFPASRSLL